MAVDDLWYLRTRDPATGDRQPSKRHGRGKRWRVRWTDPETGRSRAELFDRKVDAERYDANRKADISRGQYIDPHAGKTTVAEYAELWRKNQLHRVSTVDRCESVIRRHIVPILGSLQLAQVRNSHIKGWVKDRVQILAPSTLATIYFGTLVPMFNAAVIDRRIGVSPCINVRLPDVPNATYYIATREQVGALYKALPERYRAIVYLAAGCGWRGGEIFGLELDGLDFLRGEVHVRQQLITLSGREPFLARPKTKTSARTNELPDITANALAHHLQEFPAIPMELSDETDPRKPLRRIARLVFTDTHGQPIRRANWSHIWRSVVAIAGLPKGFGLRDLRHYFATVLIFGGANVKTVQLAMGHTTPTVTLNTYVGYWPEAPDCTRSLVNTALGCTPPVPRRIPRPCSAGQDPATD
jgi:integrase